MNRKGCHRPIILCLVPNCSKVARHSVVWTFFQAVVLMLFALPGMAEQGDVAQVSQLSGDVVIERQGEDITVVEGTRLQVGDSLKTGVDGAIGILFNDETTLSIGPKTKITIQDYLFELDTSSFSFIIKIFKGTASYVSGLIAKLSPESAEFITPSATIGIRGTKFVIEVDGL